MQIYCYKFNSLTRLVNVVCFFSLRFVSSLKVGSGEFLSEHGLCDLGVVSRSEFSVALTSKPFTMLFEAAGTTLTAGFIICGTTFGIADLFPAVKSGFQVILLEFEIPMDTSNMV